MTEYALLMVDYSMLRNYVLHRELQKAHDEMKAYKQSEDKGSTAFTGFVKAQKRYKTLQDLIGEGDSNGQV